MTTSTAALLALIASLAAEPAGPPSASNAIDLTSFAADVKQAGTDLEDWQPAFQKAVEAARRRGRALRSRLGGAPGHAEGEGGGTGLGAHDPAGALLAPHRPG